MRSREKRCAKIADLLVAGKKGSELEVAIEAYDCETGIATEIKSEGCGYLLMQVQDKPDGLANTGNGVKAPSSPAKLSTQNPSTNSAGRKEARSLTPDASHDVRFKTPLTSMFKRSSSAPAPLTRDAVEVPSAIALPSLARRDSLSSASSVDTLDTAPIPPYVVEHEDQARVVRDITTMSDSSMRFKGGNGVSPSLVAFSSSPDYTPCSGNTPQLSWVDVSNAIVNHTRTSHSLILSLF